MQEKQNKKPYGFVLGLLAVIALMHIGGFGLYLYWRLQNYDKVVHFLSGLWVAFACLYLVKRIFKKDLSRRKAFFIGIVLALLVGIAWELFELKYGITFWRARGYTADTSGDVAFDIIGGLAGSFYYLYYFNNLKIWGQKNLS